jgi:type I restriction enzyme R subunit
MTNKYSLIAENADSTVVSDFAPTYKRATHYQSEAELEKAFIAQLEQQAYEKINNNR